MTAGLNFEYGFNTNNAQLLDENTSMRVYFLGGFTSAQSPTDNKNIHAILKIDIDNFDNVMEKLSPSIELPSGEQLTFNELDDFHPDSIFEHSIFKNLRRLKHELGNSATAENAAQEILSNYQLPFKPQLNDDNLELNVETRPNIEIENNDEMFERLLGKTKSSIPSAEQESISNININTSGSLDHFLSNLLAPHITNDLKPEYRNLLLFIDTAIEELMKSILHSDEFQAIESTWRSVRNVIFNEAYDESNQLFYLVNTDKNALNNAVEESSEFAKNLSQHMKNTDMKTYDVLVGNYEFSANNIDIASLNYLASFSEAQNCKIITAANHNLIDADKTSLWHQFRQTPQARHVTLSYPRILLRMPYGKKHDKVDNFIFEELSHPHQHGNLLWGNSAFFCVKLLIRQYHNQENTQMMVDMNITELPAFVFIEDDEKVLKPCAEFLLTEESLISIKAQGIMPFASYRNKNCIRLFSDEIHAVNTNKIQ